MQICSFWLFCCCNVSIRWKYFKEISIYPLDFRPWLITIRKLSLGFRCLDLETIRNLKGDFLARSTYICTKNRYILRSTINHIISSDISSDEYFILFRKLKLARNNLCFEFQFDFICWSFNSEGVLGFQPLFSV